MRTFADPALSTLSVPVFSAVFALAVAPLSAGESHGHDHGHGEEARQLGAHVHGEGTMQIAIDGDQVAMRFESPSADIVGFEHAPSTDAQRAAVDDAIAALSRPGALFVIPAAAGCSLVKAGAAMLGAEPEDEHGDHDDHAHDHDHARDEHADHDDHGGDGHSEFHAEYEMSCEDPSAIDRIEFVYFERFPDAKQIEVTVIGPSGAQSFEATRQAPVVELKGLL